jgi:hypothetical protein
MLFRRNSSLAIPPSQAKFAWRNIVSENKIYAKHRAFTEEQDRKIREWKFRLSKRKLNRE